jgi:hypothetical protein
VAGVHPSYLLGRRNPRPGHAVVPSLPPSRRRPGHELAPTCCQPRAMSSRRPAVARFGCRRCLSCSSRLSAVARSVLLLLDLCCRGSIRAPPMLLFVGRRCCSSSAAAPVHSICARRGWIERGERRTKKENDSGEAFDANQKWLSSSGRFQRMRSTSFFRHIPRIWISSSPASH